MTEILGIVRDGKLIPEDMWIKLVSSIENNFEGLETNPERAKREVAEKLTEAVKRRATNRFGILFSGGVDSTIISFIAKKLGCNFVCYSVGIETSDDLKWAQAAAKEYGFELKTRILTLDELEIVVKNVVNILKEADVTKVSVGAVLYAGAKLALNDGINTLFGGIGSEEIFAGYQRHSEALGKNNYEALHKECWNGMKQMWKRDLQRDFLIAKSLNEKMMAQFLDKDLVKYAMSIHPMHKLDSLNKKIILRHAADFLGIKKEFAWRKKQAAQYGSDFVKGIDKLATKKGFRYKKEYLESLILN